MCPKTPQDSNNESGNNNTVALDVTCDNEFSNGENDEETIDTTQHLLHESPAHGGECSNRHACEARWGGRRTVFAALFLTALGFFAGVEFDRWQGKNNAENSDKATDLSGTLRGHEIAATAKTSESASSTKTTVSKFLVISQQRSGSRFMTSLLDDHSKITCGAEELIDLEFKHMPLELYVQEVEHAWTRLLKKATSSSHHKPNLVGFKVMNNQGILHYGTDLMAELDRMGVRVIHLVRRNKLLQYVSDRANKKDKNLSDKHIAHPETEADASKLRSFTVDGSPEKVLNWMESREKQVTKVSNLLSSHIEINNYMEIDYEDVSKNTNDEMARVFSFLGVDFEEVSTSFKKIHKDKRTRDYFQEGQREDLRKALKESRFAWVLDGW